MSIRDRHTAIMWLAFIIGGMILKSDAWFAAAGLTMAIGFMPSRNA